MILRVNPKSPKALLSQLSHLYTYVYNRAQECKEINNLQSIRRRPHGVAVPKAKRTTIAPFVNDRPVDDSPSKYTQKTLDGTTMTCLEIKVFF